MSYKKSESRKLHFKHLTLEHIEIELQFLIIHIISWIEITLEKFILFYLFFLFNFFLFQKIFLPRTLIIQMELIRQNAFLILKGPRTTIVSDLISALSTKLLGNLVFVNILLEYRLALSPINVNLVSGFTVDPILNNVPNSLENKRSIYNDELFQQFRVIILRQKSIAF